MFIDNELDTLDESDTKDLSTDFTLGDCLFSAAMLTKSSDKDNYGYSGSGIGFGERSLISLSNGKFSKNAIIFGVGNSSSMHADNRKRYLRFFGAGLTDGLDEF